MSKKRLIKKGSAYHELMTRANNDGGICDKCGKKTDFLTVDHIVPYSFVFEMGMKDEQMNHDWNFQLLCRPCNRLKGASFDFTDKRTFPNLKKYVELAEEYYAA